MKVWWGEKAGKQSATCRLRQREGPKRVIAFAIIDSIRVIGGRVLALGQSK